MLWRNPLSITGQTHEKQTSICLDPFFTCPKKSSRDANRKRLERKHRFRFISPVGISGLASYAEVLRAHHTIFSILVPRGRAIFGHHKESRALPRSNTESPRFTDFPSLCACSESSLTNLIGFGLNLLCLQSHSEPGSHWTYPEMVLTRAVHKQEPITRSLHPPHIPAMAFSQTDLFLAWIYSVPHGNLSNH